MAHELALRASSLWVDEDGIFRGKARPGANEDIEGARATIAHMRAVGGGRPLRFLMDIRAGRYVSREARAYLASAEAAEVIVAGALLVDSGVSRAIGNFFLRIAQPPRPTRLFTSEAEALAWLKTIEPAES